MGTIVDVICNKKTYYECPGCEQEVWAFGAFAGTQCWGCTGKNPLKGIFDIACHTADMGTVGITSTVKDTLTNNKITYRCPVCKKRKWCYGSTYVNNTCWDCMLTTNTMDLLTTGLKFGSQVAFATNMFIPSKGADKMSSISFDDDMKEFEFSSSSLVDDHIFKYKPSGILSSKTNYSSFNTVNEFKPIYFNYDLQTPSSLHLNDSFLSETPSFLHSNNALFDSTLSELSELKLSKYKINTYKYNIIKPEAKAWTYSQSTGIIKYGDTKVGVGYSGIGVGLNNPKYDYIKNVGPIPTGVYQMGSGYHHQKLGPITMNLDPIGHNAKFRTAFRIHGDNAKTSVLGLKLASQGCIVLPPSIRKKLSGSKCDKLIVID